MPQLLPAPPDLWPDRYEWPGWSGRWPYWVSAKTYRDLDAVRRAGPGWPWSTLKRPPARPGHLPVQGELSSSWPVSPEAPGPVPVQPGSRRGPRRRWPRAPGVLGPGRGARGVQPPHRRGDRGPLRVARLATRPGPITLTTGASPYTKPCRRVVSAVRPRWPSRPSSPAYRRRGSCLAR